MGNIFRLIILLFFVSCTSRNEIKIVPLNPYFKRSMVEGKVAIQAYFLVRNWNNTSEKSYDLLNDFADKYKRADTSKCSLYEINFYQESSSLNDDFIESESDLIEWHSKELIFSKDWEDNKVMSILKFQNGVVIDTADIKLIDIR